MSIQSKLTMILTHPEVNAGAPPLMNSECNSIGPTLLLNSMALVVSTNAMSLSTETLVAVLLRWKRSCTMNRWIL